MVYLVLADVHANLPALEAVLDAPGDWDELLFLGDAVDAGPHPDETLSLLADQPGHFVMGNHDRAVLEASPDEPAATPDQRWCQWTREQLSTENLRFLSTFSDSTRLETRESAVRLHHGDFPPEWGVDWDGRLWPDSAPSLVAEVADRFAEPHVLFAHSHVQFRRRHGERTLANPGSVGQHRLGETRACYALLEDGELSFESTAYDPEGVLRAMEEFPLPEEFIEDRKTVYTEGRLPDRYDLRDFTPLRRAGYR